MDKKTTFKYASERERVMDELSENAQLAANAVASSVDATNKED